MRLSTVIVGGAIASATVLAPAAAAVASPAGSNCGSAYSGSQACPQATHFHKAHPTQPTSYNRPSTASTLPFTGADVAGMTALGVGAIGAGAAFVVAGRRRRAPQA